VKRKVSRADYQGGLTTLSFAIGEPGKEPPTEFRVFSAGVNKTDKGNWLCGDVTIFPFAEQQYDLWHDRAVFHFLTDSKDRAAYVRQVAHAVNPGGHVIVATFGPEGPTTCSGLDVVRYDSGALHDELGPTFQLVKHLTELHQTPAGATQQFSYCYCNTSLRLC
jgi:SAM-dependent methyltransferase